MAYDWGEIRKTAQAPPSEEFVEALESLERESEPEVDARCPACGGSAHVMEFGQWACDGPDCGLVFSP